MKEERAPRRTFRLYAATAIALIVLGGLALVIFRASSRQPITNATQESIVVLTQTPTPYVASIKLRPSLINDSKPERNQAAKRDSKTYSAKERSKNFRRRLPPSSQTAVALISRWHSPTDFLLNSPGERLLKTVPRLNESVLDIKANTFDVNN
jgi:hypothetical protein